MAEPAGGLSLWVRLSGTDTRQFAQLALRNGVAVLPGPLLSPLNAYGDRLRISYHLPITDIEEGIRRLSKAWTIFTAADGQEIR